MPRLGTSPFAFPDFHGATRRLVLTNLAAFFAMALVGLTSSNIYNWLFLHGTFWPQAFLHGWLWQPITYSLVQIGILPTLLGLLSLWFLAGFLENFHSSNWVMNLYIVSVLGTALAAALIYISSQAMGFALPQVPLYGSFGGNFGLLAAIGLLYGDTQFMLFPLPIGIKARYLVVIFALIAIASMFGVQRLYAFSQLGGALAGLLYVRMAPRRGVSFMLSESWYGMRNRYYRWKRKRAARKFEVYMKSQGRTVRFDGSGRQIIDEDQDDKTRWN
jgi:membrane associated rhomboid family serine protease